MTAIMDVIASIALAAQLNSGSVAGPRFMQQSMPLSVIETKQGMYKEYTVDKVDDSALDEIRRGYKTAEETDEGKTKVNQTLLRRNKFMMRSLPLPNAFSILNYFRSTGQSLPCLLLAVLLSQWHNTTGMSLRRIEDRHKRSIISLLRNSAQLPLDYFSKNM